MMDLCEGFVFMAEFFGWAIRVDLCQPPNFAYFFYYVQEKKVDTTFNYKVFAVKTFKRIEYAIHAVIWFCCPFKFPIGCSNPYRKINLCWQRAETFHLKNISV